MTLEEYLKKFKSKIKSSGLNQSNQREQVIEVFFNFDHHVDVETLHSEVKKKYPKIGYTTIYRTLKMLETFNMALTHSFSESVTLFEPVKDEKSHHDHLICLKCGLIIEFENKEIEILQNEVADKNSFLIKHHSLQIYGFCKSCQKK